MWHQHPCRECGLKISLPNVKKASCLICAGHRRAPLCAGCEIRELTRGTTLVTSDRDQ